MRSIGGMTRHFGKRVRPLRERATFSQGFRSPTRHIAVARPSGRLRRSNLQSCRFSRWRSSDVPVFFRALPGGACDFSLRGQREVTKRKATPRTRPAPIHGLRVRSRPPGFAEGPSMARRRTGAHPVRHPAGASVARSPCSRGPVGRASCAQPQRSTLLHLASAEAMDGRQRSGALYRALARRRASQRQAGARRACSRPWMAEFAPARLAQDAQGS
jgi:hypothetical protein